MALDLLYEGSEWPQLGDGVTVPGVWGSMKTYHILLGNCEELLNDFIRSLFEEVCGSQTAVRCTRTAQIGDFMRHGCAREFDLIIQVPHNLFPDESTPTPISLIGESICAIRAIKANRTAPIIAIVALEERARYEPLLLEAGADCVLELPFDGDQLRLAIGRLLQLPARHERPPSKQWFFAGVLMRGLRRLSQA
jgi:hypothetical protein